MNKVVQEAGDAASAESSAEIMPEHLLRCLISSDKDLIRRAKESLPGIASEIDSDAAGVLDRLSAMSNRRTSARRKAPALSNISEKLLHDAEMIAVLKSQKVSRGTVLSAMVFEIHSKVNQGLERAAYALGMRAAPEPGPAPSVFHDSVQPRTKSSSRVSKESLGCLIHPQTKVQNIDSMIFKNDIEAVAEQNQGPTWLKALNNLNIGYKKPIEEYIVSKVIIKTARLKLFNPLQAGRDAASEFFASRLADGTLYKKFMEAKKRKGEALHFRYYLIESANNFIYDFIGEILREPLTLPDDEAPELPSASPSPSVCFRRNERDEIVSAVFQKYISELLGAPSGVFKGLERNKCDFFITCERFIFPSYYLMKEPPFRVMAEKLSNITGGKWTLADIAWREYEIVVPELKKRLGENLGG